MQVRKQDELGPRRTWHEAALMAAMVLGAAFLIVGAAGSVLLTQFTRSAGALLGAGLILSAFSYILSFDIGIYRRILRPAGGERYEQLRRWTRIKASSLFLSLVVLFGGIVLALAALSRSNLVEAEIEGRVMGRMMALLLATMGATIAYAHHQSLRIRLDRDRNMLRRAYNSLAVVAAIALGAVGYLSMRDPAGFGPLRAVDGPFLVLAGLTILGADLFMARGLPTLLQAFNKDPSSYRGHTHFSRGKSVTMPILVAFGLLFVLLLLFLVFGVGLLNAVDKALENTVAIFVLMFFLIAMVVSFAVSFYLARQEDKPILYQKKKTREQTASLWIAASSLTLAGVLALLALYVAYGDGAMGLSKGAWVELSVMSVMVAVGPYGFYKASRAKHVRKLEARFPDFLRDLASSHKGGLTLSASVFVASKGDYGVLTPEVHKMADQLSWNVPFEEALRRFGERVHTPIVQRTVSLVLEASRSGGSTADVLLTAARDAREIKNLEDQRRLSMGLYTAVIYITFLVFLVVVAVMSAQFVPEVIKAAAAAEDTGATAVGGISFRTPSAEQFRTFYFMAAVVQGVGDGIVAGMMGSGRAANGLVFLL
jgi:Flp pilus assembly protein TadB